jgi:hypothetical protein
VPIENTQSGSMLAIFTQESEFCAPSFRETIDGSKLKFTQRMISVPCISLIDDESLVMTLQIETEVK